MRLRKRTFDGVKVGAEMCTLEHLRTINAALDALDPPSQIVIKTIVS